MIIDGTNAKVRVYMDEEYFSLDCMRRKNKESIYLDGIEDVRDGNLLYTDELIEKCKNVFGISLIRQVPFAEIEKTAQFLIEEVIEKNR